MGFCRPDRYFRAEPGQGDPNKFFLWKISKETVGLSET